MSIVTKRGDRGETTLMYNRQISKAHPRVETFGTVDELNAALGLARAAIQDGILRGRIETVQKDLVLLMGELATAVEDLPRYVKAGYPLLTASHVTALETWITETETANAPPKGWATPGANPGSAALDLARAVCRRAERRACALQETGELKNPVILIYLNRLSDLLWLLARRTEP